MIEKGEKLLIKHFPLAIKAALECLSDTENKIIEKAVNTNRKLIDYCKFYDKEIDTGIEFISIVEVLIEYIEHESISTRIAALE